MFRKINFAWGRWLVRVLAIAAVYTLSGRLGLFLVAPPDHASAFFPASGIALATILVFGYRFWPGVWIGSYLLQEWVLLGSVVHPAGPWLVSLASLGIATGAALEAVLGAYLVRRTVGFPSPLVGVKHVVKFFMLGGPIACLVSPILGLLSLSLAGLMAGTNFYYSWWTWWVGDCLGVVLVTPFALAWVGEPRAVWRPRRLSLAIPVSLAFALVVVYSLYLSNLKHTYQRLDFGRRVGTLTADLEKDLASYLNSVISARDVFSALPDLAPKEFSKTARRWLTRHSEVEAILWAPLISAMERESFESAGRRYYGQAFQITQRNSEGDLVGASHRSEYAPILFLEPQTEFRSAVGFDVAVDRDETPVIQWVRESGVPVSFSTPTLQGGIRLLSGFRVFVPLYGSHDSLTDPTVDPSFYRRLKGFLQLRLKENGAVAQLLESLRNEGVDFCAVNELGTSLGKIVVWYQSDIKASVAQRCLPRTEGAGLDGHWYQMRTHVVNNHVDTFYFPNNRYLESQMSWDLWGLLVAGVLFSGVLGAFLLVSTGRRWELEQGVLERTQDLVSVKDRLQRKVDELRKSEQRFRLLVSGVKDYAIMMLGPDGQVATWNDGAYGIFQYAERDIVGSRFSTLVKSDGFDRVEDYFTTARLKGQYEGESWMVRKDGSQFWAHVVMTVLVKSGEGAIGFSVIIRDLTERRNREAQLQESMKYVKLLRVVAGAASHASDPRKLLQFCLDEVCVLTGWQVGHIYLRVNSVGSGRQGYAGALQSSKIWHIDEKGSFEAFRRITEAISIDSSESLPGRVVATGKPVWILDVNTVLHFPRAHEAVTGGLKAGFGFPIVVEEKLIGVMEFFSLDAIEPDDSLAEVLHRIGIQLGQIISQQQSKEALVTSESRNRLILQSANDAFIAMDSGGAIIEWNTAANLTFGWTHAQAVGRNMADILVPERLQAEYRRGMEVFLETGTSPLFNRRFEIELLNSEGYELPVEVFVSPIQEGATTLFFAFIRDISVQKTAVNLLVKSEERYRNLFESARDIIATGHPDGTIASLNPAFETILGWRSADWIGKPFLALIHPDDHSIMVDLRHQLSCGGLPPMRDLRIRTVSNEYRHMEWLAKPLMENGEVVGDFGIIRDVTRRRIVEKKLRQTRESLQVQVVERTEQLQWANNDLRASNTDLEQFVFIASHDLREPLRTITSYIGLLGREFGNQFTAEAASYLGIIKEASKRLHELITDLLDYSGIRSATSQTQGIECEAVVRNVISNLSDVIEACGAEVIVTTRLPAVYGDSRQISQLFQHLITNAIKYRGPLKPKIEVSCINKNSEWVFSVSDNGIGMDMQYCERVFEIFKRLHGVETYAGTGVGLAICKRIVEKHGGRIWVQSSPGKGAVFFFSVPVFVRGHRPLSGMKILFVGSSRDTQSEVGRGLRVVGGASVDLVESVDEGVRVAMTGGYDVVMMGIEPPVCHGFEATLSLRNKGFDRPIVAFTSGTAVDSSEFDAPNGFSDFLTKDSDVQAIIGKLVQYHRASAERP